MLFPCGYSRPYCSLFINKLVPSQKKCNERPKEIVHALIESALALCDMTITRVHACNTLINQ